MNTVNDQANSLASALWRIYRRPERPVAWTDGGNLPWNDPEFSQRMLREHLDQSHSAASRVDSERTAQIDWLWGKLALEPGAQVLDFTCGPGLYALELARRGCQVLGIDFSPASISYGRAQVDAAGLAARCQFIEADVRLVELPAQQFDAALFLYGQLAVFRREEALALLAKIAESLKPGARIVIELLNPDHIDKKHSTWWFTDDAGLWGDAPFINLGERFWDAEGALSMERFYTIALETGRLDEVLLCDQSYTIAEMTQHLHTAGYGQVVVYPAWDGLELKEPHEWLVYLAERPIAGAR